MPARADAFYARLPKTNWLKAHVYHGTTVIRLDQARFFLDQLTKEATVGTEFALSPFRKRDMFLFGLTNSLRSSLDSFTHELMVFYGGYAKKEIYIQFFNLLRSSKVTITLPALLYEHIADFQKSDTCQYLNKLRNAQQHRSYPLTPIETLAPMSVNIVSTESEQVTIDTSEQDIPPQAIESKSSPLPLLKPDLRLPDDPAVGIGDETFLQSRPLLGTMRRISDETHEFILSAYDLAV